MENLSLSKNDIGALLKSASASKRYSSLQDLVSDGSSPVGPVKELAANAIGELVSKVVGQRIINNVQFENDYTFLMKEKFVMGDGYEILESGLPVDEDFDPTKYMPDNFVPPTAKSKVISTVDKKL